MELKLIVNDEVLRTIQTRGICYARNNTTFSEYAYQYMKELTGFEGLFFTIHNNEFMKANPERINELISMSNSSNKWALHLDVPKDEVYAHNYYDFSDLIFYSDENDDEMVAIIKEDLKGDIVSNERQCVINRIEQSWCKEVELFER